MRVRTDNQSVRQLRRRRLFSIAIACFILLCHSCSYETGNTIPEGEPVVIPDLPNGADLYVSNCLQAFTTDSQPLREAVNDCIEYEYDGVSTLQIRHFNTAFNCSPDSIFATATIAADSIHIVETEILGEAVADCICLYDLYLNIRDLPPGEYYLSLDQRYLHFEADRFLLRLDLSEATSGRVSIPRETYPWIE